MRISDWSSDVCSSDLARAIGYPVLIKAASGGGGRGMKVVPDEDQLETLMSQAGSEAKAAFGDATVYMEKYLGNPRHIEFQRSEEHTSELQSLMRISYAVFCLKKKKKYAIQTKHRYVYDIYKTQLTISKSHIYYSTMNR